MHKDSPTITSLRWLVGTAGLLFATWSVLDALNWAATHTLADLNVFALAGQRFSQHDIYYRAEESAAFIYPPITAALFSLLPADSPALRVAWTVGAYVVPLTVVSGYCLHHLFPQWRRTVLCGAALMCMGVLLHTQVVTFGMTMGQTDCLMLGLVVLDFLALPPRWRGALIGLATGLKLTSAVFVLLPLCRAVVRRTLTPLWDVARAGAVCGLTVVAGMVGPGQWAASRTYWLSYSEQINHAFAQIVGYQDNKSLAAVIARAWPTVSPTALQGVSVVVAVVGVVLCAQLVKRDQLLVAMAVVGQVYCLCATFTGTRHWAPTLLWVFALWVVAARLHHPRLAAVGVGVWALMQFGQSNLSGIFAPTTGDYPFTDIPAVAGVLLLVLVAVAVVRTPDREVLESGHGGHGLQTQPPARSRSQYPQSVPQTGREHKSPAPQKTPSPAAL